MNKDENKFTLFAYEKGNIENRRPIYYVSPDGKRNKKTCLANIDKATSGIKKQELYEYLLKKNVIEKEHTEFVIFCNEKSKNKNLIKQIPVIFDDYNIRLYSEYLLGKNDEEHKNKFDSLNSNVVWNVIDLVDKDSKEYDELSDLDKQKYMNGESFSATFSRLPFALSSFRKRIKDRVLGFYQDVDHQRVKDSKKLSYANLHGIKNDIETSYRDFRDSYFFLRKHFSIKDREGLEEMYKDIECENYDDLFIVNKKSEIQEEISKLKEIKKELTKELPQEKIYTVEDYLRLINNFETRESFNDFIWSSNLVTKKAKDYTNRLANSMFDSDSEDYYSESVIRDFSSKHPGVIDTLIKEFYNQKVNEKK